MAYSCGVSYGGCLEILDFLQISFITSTTGHSFPPSLFWPFRCSLSVHSLYINPPNEYNLSVFSFIKVPYLLLYLHLSFPSFTDRPTNQLIANFVILGGSYSLVVKIRCSKLRGREFESQWWILDGKISH